MSIEAPIEVRGRKANLPTHLLEVLGRKTKDLKSLGGAEHKRDVELYHSGQIIQTENELENAFLDSAFRGDVKALHMGLRRDGVSVNCSNSQGWTALHYAIFYNHRDCVEFLLSQGAQVNNAMSNGGTPLILAAQSGNLRLTHILLAKGADVSAADEKGATALYVAASLGYKELLELLIQKQASMTTVDSDGNTALHVAAQEGRREIVRLLLHHRCPTDIANKDGWTAVHYAARNGHHQVLKILEANGASINSRTIEGATPLYLSTKHPAAVEFLCKNGAEIDAVYSITGNTPLYIASWNGDTDSALKLIECGADASHCNTHNNTPLHAAARSAGARLVTGLMTHGRADPNAVNTSGATPLYIAAAADNLQAVLALAQFTITDIDYTTNEGSSALYIACWKGYRDVAQALLRRGANPNLAYHTGNTPLVAAAFNGHTDICDLLLHYSADMSAVTNVGLTALHCATYRGHASVVQLLVLRGARLDIIADNGRTPPQCARSDSLRTLYRKLEQQKRQHPRAFKWKPPPASLKKLYDPRLTLPDKRPAAAQTPPTPAHAPPPMPSAQVAAATAAAMALLSPQQKMHLPSVVTKPRSGGLTGAHGGGDGGHGVVGSPSREIANADWRPGEKDSELESIFQRLRVIDEAGGEPFLAAILTSLKGVADGTITFGERVDAAVRQMLPRTKNAEAQRDVIAALERIRHLLYSDVDHTPGDVVPPRGTPEATPVKSKGNDNAAAAAHFSPKGRHQRLVATNAPPSGHNTTTRDLMNQVNAVMKENDTVHPDELLAQLPDLNFDDPRASWPRKQAPPVPQSYSSSSCVSPASSQASTPRASHRGLRGTWPLPDGGAVSSTGDETTEDSVVIDMDELDMLVHDVGDFEF